MGSQSKPSINRSVLIRKRQKCQSQTGKGMVEAEGRVVCLEGEGRG